ncbi:MAG: alpha-ketoacid dehydrogenase subunit beta [Spirochaetaceae bacterium]|nr:alpha-ketoacid dehydrogenase subunit beta [Spirochaetaceae bacterium]MCF7948467.1 alpha-ketoacid dehydrogenase subunit beta [Spirochaetia bacterium]MCF7950925.1 alpha-ketoacid dehydrogenase subunit beta [Spirochaetaceae bacterium]
MKNMTMVQAINNALEIVLTENEKVVLYGEDVGVEGGVFRVSAGLQEKFGEKRVFDSPLAESGIAGTAVGMAATGLKPIIEMQFSGFSYHAFHQIINQVSRIRNRSRGRHTAPIVIRMPYGGGIKAPEHHSESMEVLYAAIPGLKVVIPSTPHDAKGLLIDAVRGEDPVVFMEPKRLYRSVKQEIQEEEYSIPIGKASVVQEGSDITLISYGASMKEARKASDTAQKKGISVELIDIRSIYPLDRSTIGESVRKTGRVLVVHEGPESYGPGAEVLTTVIDEAFLYLEAPPRRLSGFDTIAPYPQGEEWYIHTPERIVYELQRLVEY